MLLLYKVGQMKHNGLTFGWICAGLLKEKVLNGYRRSVNCWN